MVLVSPQSPRMAPCNMGYTSDPGNTFSVACAHPIDTILRCVPRVECSGQDISHFYDAIRTL